jgi:hypothetical protein
VEARANEGDSNIDLVNVPHQRQDSAADLYCYLKSFILSLSQGPSILQSTSEHLAIYAHPHKIAYAHTAWPECTSVDRRQKIRSSFEQAIDSVRSKRETCASCHTSVLNGQYTIIPEGEIDLDILSVPIDWRDHSAWPGCLPDVLLVQPGIVDTGNGPCLVLCLPCEKALARGRLPKFSMANHLYVGCVPSELQGLSVVEESMITLTPGFASQRAYTGHMIYFNQNVHIVTSCLPLPIEEIIQFICVLFVGSWAPSLQYLQTQAKPLVVRADRVW